MKDYEKELKILMLFILFLFPVSFFVIEYFKEYDVRKEKERMIKWHSCQPEKPLSKGEIYAKAMQEYWYRKMEWVLNFDKYNDENMGLIDGFRHRENANMCSIEDDKFESDFCYPWVINFPTLDKMLEKHYNILYKIDNYYLEFIKGELNGKPYKPEENDFLYQSKHYNENTSFSLIHHYYSRLSMYESDCCKLVDYDDYQKDLTNHNLKNKIWRRWIEEDISQDILEKVYFLRVEKIDFHVSFSDDKKFIDYFLVNHCGNLFYQF